MTNGVTQPKQYIDPDFESMPDMENTSDEALGLPDMMSIVSKMSSLIHQELLNGFLSFKAQKLAIQGARQRGALAAGFPVIWRAIESKSDDEVPGWKQDVKSQSGGFFRPAGPGQVINLSGVKPVGAFG